MSEPSGAVRDAGRCPACGARVVPGQEWCSLCLQPLGAAEEAGAAPDAVPEPVGPPADPGVLDAPGPGGPALRPRTGGDLPPGLAEAMLAELAASTAAERPLARGPLAGRGRGTRLLLGCGAAVVLGTVMLLVLTLLGRLL